MGRVSSGNRERVGRIVTQVPGPPLTLPKCFASKLLSVECTNPPETWKTFSMWLRKQRLATEKEFKIFKTII